MNGNENPADIVTKSWVSNTYFPLMKPLLLSSEMDFLKGIFVAKGSENRSSTPPPSQAKGTVQK